jgi:hypothetical protein
MKNSPPRLRRPINPRETGIALVTVLIMIVLVSVLVSITSILAIGNGRSSTDTVMGSKAQFAAEAGIENAIYQVFYKTKNNWKASTDVTVVNGIQPQFDACTYKKWSTGQWKTPDHSANLKPNKNNNESCSYSTAPATVTAPSFPNLFNDGSVHPTANEVNQGLYPSLTKTLETVGSTTTGYRSTLKREDVANSDDVTITITTTGFVQQGGKEVASKVLQQTVKLTAQAYQGDRFALLTNATNCSLCHLHIDTMQRVYADPSSTEVYNRARVAVLAEDLNLDPAHDGDTFIAGTIYGRKNISGTTAKEVYGPKWAKDIGGNLVNGYLNSGPTFGTTGIRGKPFGQTASGNVELDSEVVDAASESVYGTYGTKGTKTSFAKIYKNYPTQKNVDELAKYGGQWPDGPVPDSFPTIIPESASGKDGLISDSEWSTYVSTAQRGSLTTDENNDGTPDTLGVVYGVRRPSSSSVVDPNVAGAPISFDPTFANAGIYATTLEGLGMAQNNATFVNTILPNFLTDMRNNNTANINTFVSTYRGWLLQQALASPNNRDLQPGASNFGAPGAPSIAWPPVNGSARNNFWVNLNTTTNPPTLSLRYTDTGSGTWTNCANENSTCSFSGTGSVRFGNTNTARWINSGSTRTIACTVTAFGGVDPAPGNTLTCDRSTSGNTSGPWVQCATLGGTCTWTANTRYRIGSASATNWSATQTATNSIACNTTTFGDPWPGAAKICQVNLSITQRSIPITITDADLFPNTSNGAATSLRTGYWDGNVIIDGGRISDSGSTRKTITINGSVYINGDVVIRGQVKGRGKIIARGNIYVVGDLVYGCGDHACRITDSNGLASYRNWQQLPLLGLLAGQNVLVGDYDFPDYRATNSPVSNGGGVFDLINDQVGRDTGNGNPASNPSGVANLPPIIAGTPSGTVNSWPYYSVPGSTGTNSNNANGAGDMGFVPMSAAGANGKNCNSSGVCGTTVSNRYFQSGPFTQIVRRPPSSFGSYESGGGQINTLGSATVISLYPSNGPIRVGGNNATRGFYALPGALGSQLATGLSCSSNTANTVNNVTTVPALRFGGGTVNYNFGFYCPPNNSGVGSYLRTWNYGTTDPGQDANAWMTQSPQNTALDSNTGMTTGWLGGLLARNAAGNFQQTGDLSQTRLLKMMWLTTMESRRDLDPIASGNQAGPLRTDGIFYSAHSIFALTRSFRNTFQDARSQTEGRWIHNGSVVSAELGFLITGDYTSAANGTNTRYAANRKSAMDFRASVAITAADAGLDDPDWVSPPSFSANLNLGPAMGIFYDERLAGFLGVQNNNAIQVQRSRGYTQVPR